MRKHEANYWVEVLGVRNISVKEYEAPDLGTSGRSGDLRLTGNLHVQPKGAIWAAEFPFSYVVSMAEEPHSGTLVFTPKGKDPLARLVSMALMDYDTENQITKLLGKVEFVSHPNNEGLRYATIHLAASLPKGSPERKALLAAIKDAGISYGVADQWFSFVGNKTPFNQDVTRVINQTFIPIKSEEGQDTDVPLRFIRAYHSSPLTFMQEKSGQKREIVFLVQYPDGYQVEAVKAVTALGKKLGFKVKALRKHQDPETQG